jgi:hypothetical protein
MKRLGGGVKGLFSIRSTLAQTHRDFQRGETTMAEEANDLTPTQLAGAGLQGQAEAVGHFSDRMLKYAKPMTRFLLKRIPEAPALVFDVSQAVTPPNKIRGAFGLAGVVLGGTAGGAFGTLAGGVNAPIGAAMGATFGENIGEQIYDEHAQDIDHAVGATKQWMRDRWRRLSDAAR